MRILIINGSPRSNGATGSVLQEIKDYLEKKENMDIHYHDLGELDIQFCKGCMSCYKNGACVIENDGLEAISQKIDSSDALVIGSPTYVGDISGQLKTFIDRGHFVLEQLLHNKYCFAVSTYENASGNMVIQKLKKLFILSGASVKGSFIMKVDFNDDPFQNKKFKKKLHKKIEKFYQAIKKEKKKSLKEIIFSKIAFKAVIRPSVMNKAEAYAGVIKRWKMVKLI